MNLDEQTNSSFLGGMLKYVSEGATYDDLIAAGYTDEEIRSAFPEQPRMQGTVSGPAGKPVEDTRLGTLDTYTPTARENFRANLEVGLRAAGVPEGLIEQYATSIAGNENSMMPGLADLTPLGAAYSVQEGYRQAERGINSGSELDVALGAANTALGLVEAIPGGKIIGKGLGKVSEKLVEVYDPNVLGSNFGNLGSKGSLSPRFMEGPAPTERPASMLITEEELAKVEEYLDKSYKDTETLDMEWDRDIKDIARQKSNMGNMSNRELVTLASIKDYSEKEKLAEELVKKYDISVPNDLRENYDSPAEMLISLSPSVKYNNKEFDPIFDKYGDYEFDYSKPLKDQLLWSEGTKFRNSIVEIAQGIDYPKKGIKGSDFLKLLEKTPEVKNVRFSNLDLVDKNKFYTQEELLAELEKKTWSGTFKKLSTPQYSTYQRQDLEDYDFKSGEYGEFTFAADRNDPSLPTFRLPQLPDGISQFHFDDNVLAHTRATIYTNKKTNERELVVEELQSDYIQQGWAKPVKASTTEALAEQAFSALKDFFVGDMAKPLSDPEIADAIKDRVGNLIHKIWYGTQRNPYKMESKAFQQKLKSFGLEPYQIEDIYAVIDNQAYSAAYSNPKEDVIKPPIQKTKDSVEVALEGLLGEAQINGVDKIYVPSLEQIAAERFSPGSYDFFAATRPGQGFHETYVNSLQEVLSELKADTGLSYKPEVRTSAAHDHYTGLGQRETEIFDEISAKGRAYKDYLDDKIDAEEFFNRTQTTPDQFREDFPNQIRRASRKHDQWTKIFQKALYEEMVDMFGELIPFDNTGTLIDISEVKNKVDFTRPRFAEGGMVEDKQMRRLLEEGGMTDDGMEVEPTTGNRVPPGSLASEVRDDIPAQLSEGEYVVPADVVRFFGVKFFEDLRMKAKQGLSEMDAEGRIGGKTVDSSGVPLDDDELSPEEEQMLMEALGQGQEASMGMAEGGDTKGFDRTQFQLGSGLSIRNAKYINPQTKEIRYFQFAGSTPLGLIPEGFVPWTAELEGQTQTPITPIPEPTTSGGTRKPANTVEVKTSEEAGQGYESWAEKNYESIMNDPYQFGLNALQDTSGQMLARGAGALGLATGAAPVALLGAAVKTANLIGNISDARAALKVMEAQGLAGSAAYKDLEEKTKKLAAQVPLADWGLFGTGENKYEAIVAKKESGLTTSEGSGRSTRTTAPAPQPAKPTSTAKPASSSSTSSNKPFASELLAKANASGAAGGPIPQVGATGSAGANGAIGSTTTSALGASGTVGVPKVSVGGSAGYVDRTALEDRRAVGGLMTKKKVKAPKKGLAGK